MADDARRGNPRRTNRLGGEVSAYLRQHMHNPVDWYPWGEEALSRARDEDRPLLVSIGYSACHWCHVMERESFEDAETAALMNDGFINIKVDREERPDVDQIYMDAVMRLNGHGGWPLTIFCTPDGRPFYGGTYFPPEPRQGMPGFRQLLSALSDAYHQRRDEVEESAAHILAALSQRPASGAGEPPGPAPLLACASELLREADSQNGGFGGAPKFPTPVNLDALLLAADFLPDEEAPRALRAVVFSCREMARRGLYDHLGGGFHRYCVDEGWEIPHFEKMLYDQGLLLASYAEAWRRTRDEALGWPLRETAGYLQRELRAPDGGFFASQDADSEGEEGRYYVWRPEEIAALLGPRAEAFCEAYSVTEEGNFEAGRSHLVDRARRPRADFAEERRALQTARAARVPPATDPKRVAAWNGYAVSGLARAGSLLGDEAMLDAAVTAADFALGRMMDPDGRVMRVFDGGRASVAGFLDDHAALQTALLDLHRAGAGERYLAAALRISDQIAERFYDPREEDLFLTPADGEPLIHRPRSDHDGATPHATGLAVLGLLRAAELCARGDLREIAERVLRSHTGVLQRAPRAFPTLARAAAIAARGLATVVVAGDPRAPETDALALCARRGLRPEDAVLLRAPGETPPPELDPSWFEGREPVGAASAAYLCCNGSCSLPATDPVALTAAMSVR